MTDLNVVPLVDEGLGNSEYLVDLGDGRALVVDVRPVDAFSAAHVPGSVSVPLRPVFATWLGWLTEHDRPLVIVRDETQDPGEVLWQARKIGHDRIVGEVDGGMGAWTAAGGPTANIPLVDATALGGRTVLDVRQRQEFEAGHVPGAVNVELGSLTSPGPDLPVGPTVVMCGHGERAMGAASLLAGVGDAEVTVLQGGPQAWAEVTGGSVEVAE